MKKLFDSIPCKVNFELREDNCVHLEEAYFGPCPWCYALIYTRDICTECGKMVDIS